MITLPKLRELVAIKPAAESALESTLAGVVESWDQETGLLWRRATGYVQTITPDDGGETTLLLKHAIVTSVTKVEKRTLSPGAEFEDVDEDDWLFTGRRGVRSLGPRWTGLVRVTYDGGYVDNGAPADVLLAIATQVQFLLERTQGDKLTTAAVSNPQGGSTTFLAPDLHPLFKRTAALKARR